VIPVETVIVQVSESAADQPDGRQLVSLGPGDIISFGRGAPECAVGITLSGNGISRYAGEIVAADDYWRLSNFSGVATYVVENLEGAGEHIKVSPGRLGAPIPFELSRVLLPRAEGFTSFQVFAPQHMYAPPGGDVMSGDLTVPPFTLDQRAKYFLVLVALCEPRLRDPSSVAIPSVSEVAERLRPLPAGRHLTGSAVNFHIDYLASAKLRVRERAGADETARIDWKREAVVALALRFNLVREEHLALLPARRTAARR
jgi:serine/threonine-protein kinase